MPRESAGPDSAAAEHSREDQQRETEHDEANGRKYVIFGGSSPSLRKQIPDEVRDTSCKVEDPQDRQHRQTKRMQEEDLESKRSGVYEGDPCNRRLRQH